MVSLSHSFPFSLLYLLTYTFFFNYVYFYICSFFFVIWVLGNWSISFLTRGWILTTVTDFFFKWVYGNAVTMWAFSVSVSGFCVPLSLVYSSWSMFFQGWVGVWVRGYSRCNKNAEREGWIWSNWNKIVILVVIRQLRIVGWKTQKGRLVLCGRCVLSETLVLVLKVLYCSCSHCLVRILENVKQTNVVTIAVAYRKLGLETLF